jgi:uncharacterized phage protein (TIGR01671 family)
MKREIKFRAWHLDNGMLYFDLDSFINDYHNQYGNIMQFTGLHDKNGKDIYEGDIIGNKEKDNEDNIYICEFSIEDAAFLFCSPFDGEVLEQNNFVNDLEIIGNIYENPNLL